jgi:hypothetical protein
MPPPNPPPANIAPKPAPIAKPAKGPNHLLPAAGAAGAAPGVTGAGAAVGAFGAAGWGVIVRCLPILPPPPKRLASAVAANIKLKLVRVIINIIKKRVIASILKLSKTGASIANQPYPTGFFYVMQFWRFSRAALIRIPCLDSFS